MNLYNWFEHFREIQMLCYSSYLVGLEKLQKEKQNRLRRDNKKQGNEMEVVESCRKEIQGHRKVLNAR